MKSLIAVILLQYFLFAVQSAPIRSTGSLPAFTEAAQRAKTLVEKILRDIPAVHTATIHTQGLTLDSAHTANLQMMMTSLDIPAAPVLKPLSERFTLDVCVSRMAGGSQLYHGLLGVLSDQVGGLSDLRADLRDLLTHINKMKEVAQLSAAAEQNYSLNLASRLRGDYEIQVAVHLTLTQLRSFCHDMIRSLRAAATQGPR